ncbi:DUF1254 domain-containing protein [Microbulbifer magnicolonia]|uniref:DUF1254 domain-containing protein n=1 Tax=Microbulbifer magnicolonia TaxID=3109744 RepID=UPI002B409982|nr:DUF1254 domain-containing protein [Microbulbifer sp. GG15]
MKNFLRFTALVLWLLPLAASLGAQAPSVQEAREIARDAYIYAYPLVIMHLSRQVATNVEKPQFPLGPINQLAHARSFPDASMDIIASPNADTLYSSMNFDVSNEPLIITVPDSGGRYFLLPFLDEWTDVFTVPGKRTTGTRAQTFAIVGPGWEGELPAGVTRYDSPTASGWMGGRVQTNGKADYEAVYKFQQGMKVVPLSAYGKPYTPPKGAVDPKWDMSPPVDQVAKMDAETFFSLFAEGTKSNPPHAHDYPILDRMKRIGIEPGKSFSLDDQPNAVREALEAAPAEALPRIVAAWKMPGTSVNGWNINLTGMGNYGTNYLRRAAVAYGGLGANVPEDAVYPTTFTDADGEPLRSDRRYIVHFDRGQLPPVRAFWSLTMYNDRQLFADNPIDRFAIGDRDKLELNPDGSLDLYIQRESPGPEKESNWLPTPASGDFSLMMRLYWPALEVLDGSWEPPPVKRVD